MFSEELLLEQFAVIAQKTSSGVDSDTFNEMLHTADSTICDFIRSNPKEAIYFFSDIIVDIGKDMTIRSQAAIYLKNMLKPSVIQNIFAIQKFWRNLEDQEKVINALAQGIVEISNIRAICAGAFGLLFSVSQKEKRLEYFDFLFTMLDSEMYTNEHKEGVFLALYEAFLRRSIEAYLGDLIIEIARRIVPYCISFMDTEKSESMQIIGMKCFIEFTRNCAEKDRFIFEDDDIIRAAFDVFSNLYGVKNYELHELLYDMLLVAFEQRFETFVESIDDISEALTVDFASSDEKVVEIVISFWANIAKIEKRINSNPEISFVGQFIEVLLPLLFQLLAVIDDSNENWRVDRTEKRFIKQTRNCLENFILFSSDVCVSCFTFFEENAGNEDWKIVYAALSALRAALILKRSDLGVNFKEYIPVLLELASNEKSIIREESRVLFAHIIRFYGKQVINNSIIQTTIELISNSQDQFDFASASTVFRDASIIFSPLEAEVVQPVVDEAFGKIMPDLIGEQFVPDAILRILQSSIRSLSKIEANVGFVIECILDRCLPMLSEAASSESDSAPTAINVLCVTVRECATWLSFSASPAVCERLCEAAALIDDVAMGNTTDSAVFVCFATIWRTVRAAAERNREAAWLAEQVTTAAAELGAVIVGRIAEGEDDTLVGSAVMLEALIRSGIDVGAEALAQRVVDITANEETVKVGLATGILWVSGPTIACIADADARLAFAEAVMELAKYIFAQEFVPEEDMDDICELCRAGFSFFYAVILAAEDQDTRFFIKHRKTLFLPVSVMKRYEVNRLQVCLDVGEYIYKICKSHAVRKLNVSITSSEVQEVLRNAEEVVGMTRRSIDYFSRIKKMMRENKI